MHRLSILTADNDNKDDTFLTGIESAPYTGNISLKTYASALYAILFNI